MRPARPTAGRAKRRYKVHGWLSPNPRLGRGARCGVMLRSPKDQGVSRKCSAAPQKILASVAVNRRDLEKAPVRDGWKQQKSPGNHCIPTWSIQCSGPALSSWALFPLTSFPQYVAHETAVVWLRARQQHLCSSPALAAFRWYLAPAPLVRLRSDGMKSAGWR